MKTIPHISDTEWTVMREIWSKGPMTASQVVNELSEKTSWNHRTIKTFLSRLVKKGALGVDKKNRTFTYYAIVPEAECVRIENETFLDRVHGGALQAMLASFLDARKFSPEEIAELKRILDKKKE